MKQVFLAAILGCAAAVASATPLLIQDGGFDNSNVPLGGERYGNGYRGYVVDAPWVFANGAGIANNSTAWGGVARTSSVVFLQDVASLHWAPAELSQTFTSDATDYMVSFDMAQRPNNHQSVQITLDGKVLGGGVLTPAGADWATYSFNISGLLGSSHTIDFKAATGTDSSLFLDNIKVSAAEVPSTAVDEPGTISMFLAGLCMLGFTAGSRRAVGRNGAR
ncbi:hypothetical protein LJR289_004813 [Pseudoduganella sp. LjRoot289]|uniref:PEP-CTERM sorting domain-containing protein n=1 Tax=Pseudoduganella sp. LjRoot289 TaxID=3342314 RepID=UPI003ECCDB27